MTGHVAAVNRLTQSWLREYRGGSGVVSGAGLWPLLAILAASADPPGREELSAVVGVEPDDAMDAARDVLAMMDDTDGVDAALGLWAQAAAGVRPEWRSRLPVGTFGELTGEPGRDQPMLDDWARERTRGIIERFPIAVDPELMLILATALTLKTSWVHTFSDEVKSPKAGPWRGRRLAALSRTTKDLDDTRVADISGGRVTLTRVQGDNGLDVHLALGEESASVSDVLTRAITVLTDPSVPAVGGSAMMRGTGQEPSELGPGLSVVRAQREGLQLTTARFTVRSDHHLLENAQIFGLETVTSPHRGHFSQVSQVPLRVDEARQSAVAIFSAEGFEAAAVTAIGLRMVSMPVYNARALAVSYDRPFGFLATHRDSGLVLFAGWVDTPEAPAAR